MTATKPEFEFYVRRFGDSAEGFSAEASSLGFPVGRVPEKFEVYDDMGRTGTYVLSGNFTQGHDLLWWDYRLESYDEGGVFRLNMRVFND